MKKKIIYWIVGIVFYIIYFLISKFIFEDLIPLNPMGSFIAILILTVVNIPLSVFSTEKLISMIKEL